MADTTDPNWAEHWQKDLEAKQAMADAEQKIAKQLEPLSKFSPLTHVSLSPSQAFDRRRASRVLWHVISMSAEQLSFQKYRDFIDNVIAHTEDIVTTVDRGVDKTALRQRALSSVDTYQILKAATQFWLLQQASALDVESYVPMSSSLPNNDIPDDQDLTDLDLRNLRKAYYKNLTDQYSTGAFGVLPFFDRVIKNLGSVPIKQPITVTDASGTQSVFTPLTYGILPSRVTAPIGIELIWSYWMEESGLVQAMNAISHRFQNRRGPYSRDPLTNFTTDPLRGLSTVLWGWVKDEYSRLSVLHRAYEYISQYGLPLVGRAVPAMEAVDVRARFIDAFHDLLYVAHRFYRDNDDTTIAADAFPLLNALKAVHLLLAEGMHNQYGDLTWTARMEMYQMQWILAQPEVREFLQSRPMMPYPEGWMGPLDTMNKIQGWNDASVIHFFDLATFGEQILLSVRFNPWADPTMIRDDAANWALHFRDAVYKYIHAYRTVTGVDLTAEPVSVSGAATRDRDPRYRAPADLLRAVAQHAQLADVPTAVALPAMGPSAAAIGSGAAIPQAVPVPRLPGPGR